MSNLPNENEHKTEPASPDGIQRVSVDPAVIKVELLISKLLRIGVVISLVIMTTGVILGAIQHRPTHAPAANTDEAVLSQPAELTVPGHVGQATPTTPSNTAVASTSNSASTSSASISTPPFVPTLRSLPKGIVTFDGIAWMTVGLLVLIATPVMRVAISALLFARMGDRIFVGITLFVLTMLIVSFFLGHGK